MFPADFLHIDVLESVKHDKYVPTKHNWNVFPNKQLYKC